MVQWMLQQKSGNSVVPLEGDPGGDPSNHSVKKSPSHHTVKRTDSGDEASSSGTLTRAVSGDGWAGWASSPTRNFSSRHRVSVSIGGPACDEASSSGEFAGLRKDSFFTGEHKGSQFLTPAKPKTVQDHVTRMLGSRGYIYGTILCTLWVIGGDDVYVLQNPPVSLDQSVYCLYVVCGALFMLDLLMRVKWEVGYRLGFYFWLDLIALVSLVPEVVWVVASHDVFNPAGEQTASEVLPHLTSHALLLFLLYRPGRLQVTSVSNPGVLHTHTHTHTIYVYTHTHLSRQIVLLAAGAPRAQPHACHAYCVS